MPDGYRRRQPYILPSPWLGLGAGLGGALSSFFEARRGKKEAEIEDVGRVFERATLTGDREPLARLIDESPEAAEAFRARTGIDIFRMTLPEVEMPEDMPLEFPPVEEMGPPAPGAPPRELPPAMVGAPQPVAPTDVPWPTEPVGMQARVMQEQVAGRELPEAMRKPEPSPLETITKDYKAIGTTLEALPTQRHKQAFLQAIEPHMPQGFPTEYTGPALEPPTPKEIELINKLYPNMTDEQRTTWRETRIAPFEAPAPPATPEMRMTISEFLKAYPDASDEEWTTFLESDGAVAPQRAPTVQSDKNTEVSLFNRSFEIAMLTGESQPEVYAQLVNNTYESTKYLVEKKKSDEIGILRMMLMDAYRLGNEKEAEKMMERLSVLTGIPYEKRGKWWERVLDALRGTQQYTKPRTPEEERSSREFEEDFVRR